MSAPSESGLERVQNAWARLEVQDLHGTPASFRIGPGLRANEVKLSRDENGDPHLLVKLPRGRTRPDIPVGAVLPHQWRELREDGETVTRLDISCPHQRLYRTFFTLIGQMLDSVGESGVDAYIELNRVLASWRKALRLENRPVDRQAVIGLFAELTVLLRLAEQDPDSALHAWRGPEGHRHDFSRTNALEVKGYTNEASTVTIHGLRQLDPPPSGDLHLLAMRLEESTAGRTLADLIEELDGRGISVDMLEQRCDSQEPLFSDSEIRLHILSERVFHVGSDFPGLRESRLSPQALKGVDRVAYTLHLDACPNELNEGDVRRVIHEL